MSLGESAGSSQEALLELQIARLQIILVPSREQAPTADTTNTRVVDCLDAIHDNPDTRGQVDDPVVRVRPDAGYVTEPFLDATGAVRNGDLPHLLRSGAGRTGESHGRRGHGLCPRATGDASHTQTHDGQERQYQRSPAESHLCRLANYVPHVPPLPVLGTGCALAAPYNALDSLIPREKRVRQAFRVVGPRWPRCQDDTRAEELSSGDGQPCDPCCRLSLPAPAGRQLYSPLPERSRPVTRRRGRSRRAARRAGAADARAVELYPVLPGGGRRAQAARSSTAA